MPKNGDTTPPVITVTYPFTNSLIASSNFTLIGSLDDDTAALIVSNNAGSQTVSALVERGGGFSVPNLLVPNPTNVFTLFATDAAGNTSTQSLTVLQSSITLTIDPLTADELSQPTVTVSGTVNSAADISVNGTPATLSGDTWSATVASSGGSYFVALVQATDASVPMGDLALNAPMPPSVQATSFAQADAVHYYVNRVSEDSDYFTDQTTSRTWALGKGGNSQKHNDDASGVNCDYYVQWPTNWPGGADLAGTSSCDGSYDESTPAAWRTGFFEYTQAAIGHDDTLTLDWPFTRQVMHTARTEIQLMVSGPAQMGAQKLIRLTASAATYVGDTDFDDAGNTPVLGDQIQLFGQTLTATATNANVGEMYTNALAGSALKIPCTVLDTNGILVTNYSIAGQAQEITLVSLTVVSNSATNIDGTNWAVVKTTNANDYVTVQATLSDTNVPLTNIQAALMWSNGIVVPGNPLQWQVSKTNSVETVVTASLGSSNLTQNVWVIWATMQILTSGTNTSPLPFHYIGDHTEILGIHYFTTTTTDDTAEGKICGIATITPAGVHSIITNGWDFFQKITSSFYADGIYRSDGSYMSWTNDGPISGFKTVIPDNTDNLYTVDAPNLIAGDAGATNSLAKYANFYDYITWNNQICCDTNDFWHFQAKWNIDQTPQFNSLDVGAGTITLP